MTKHKTINKPISKPSREEAMDAVRTMIAWAGDCLLYTSPSPRD